MKNRAVTTGLLSLFLLTAAGCSGTKPNGDPDGGNNTPTLSVSPADATTTIAGAALDFTATETNSTDAITWTLTGPGTISATSGTTTTYTPPASGVEGTATLTATAGSLSASTTITIKVRSLAITPAAVNASLGGAGVDVTATLSNSSAAVTWVLTGVGSLSATTGTTVRYTAPAAGSAATASIQATAGDLVATAPVFVNAAPTRTAQVVAYAWANDPSSASYTPSTTYSYNASGGAITATRSAVGAYSMSFAGLPATFGDVQVTGYGSDKRCNINNWGAGAASVNCFDAAGNPADSQYTIRITHTGISSRANTVGYALANAPTSTSYTPAANTSYSASGQAISVARSAVGVYVVSFAGLTLGGGDVQVSAYGSDKYCVIGSWAGSPTVSIGVYCYDHTGAAADSPFTVEAIANNVFSKANQAAYAWTNLATSTTDYEPSITYSYNSSGQHISASRSAVGTYTLRLPGQDLTNANIKVSGYSSSAQCNVNGQSGSAVDVRCYDGTGALVDSRYTLGVTLPNAPNTANTIAYAWAHAPSTASYAPSGSYAYNASGGTITAARTAAGTYSISFAGLDLSGGDIQVGAYGSGNNARCNIGSWGGTSVNVNCVDPTGAPIDSIYVIRVTANGVFSAANTVAFAWAHDPTSSSYTPSTSYAFNAGGGAVTATRSAAGSYIMSFAGLNIATGNVQVSAYGSSDYCHVGSWSGTDVSVYCYDHTGTLTDSRYFVSVVLNDTFSPISTVAYAWGNDDASASYVPSTGYSYNSSGQPLSATRSAVGVYQIKFAGLNLGSGNVNVSGYGSNKACNVSVWSGDTVQIGCVDNTGAAADSRYTVSIVR